MIARLLRSALVVYLAVSLVAGAPVYAQAASQSQTQNPPPADAQAPPPASPPASPAAGQSQYRDLAAQSGPDYSRGKRAFPNFLSAYFPIHVDAPTFTNSPRIDQLIHDGQLILSLEDAISLALENNLDISVERYVPWFAETDILRSEAGGAPRGTAGTGTASVLGSVPLSTFDPIITSSYNWERTSVPVNNPFISGIGQNATVEAVTEYQEQTTFGVSQAFHTGTTINVTLSTTRGSSNIPDNFFNPVVQSTLTFQIQQQLLNGFGLLPNIRFILESKNSKKIADSAFAQQVVTTVQQVEVDYWELVYARENVKVEESAVATSQKLYEDNKKQVEIGTLAPIEIIRAESQLATDRQNLIVAQTGRMQQQTVLLHAITKDPVSHGLLDIEVIPTDEVSKLPQIDTMPLDEALKIAWAKRPEVTQAELMLKNDGIEVKVTRNALLPTLSVFGEWQGTGLAGNEISTVTPPLVVSTSGLWTSMSQAFSTQFPTYAAGLNFTMALRNRSAQADSARAMLNERQDQTKYQQLKNSILVDVRNALISLQQGQAQVEAAGKARELAQETLDAEEKKYQLGASTTFQVIQDQRDLTAARGTEIRAQANLQEARVAYDKALGRVLEVNHITVADAAGGHLYRNPLIPGTPTTAVLGYSARQPGQN